MASQWSGWDFLTYPAVEARIIANDAPHRIYCNFMFGDKLRMFFRRSLATAAGTRLMTATVPFFAFGPPVWWKTRLACSLANVSDGQSYVEEGPHMLAFCLHHDHCSFRLKKPTYMYYCSAPRLLWKLSHRPIS